MTFTNHVLTGGLLGRLLHQPVLIVPTGLVSHFVLDSLPHLGRLRWRTFKIVLAIDIITGIVVWAVMMKLWPTAWLPISLGAAACAAPDLQQFPIILRRTAWLPRLYRFHARIQWGERRWGIIPELLWATLMVGGLRQIR